jgi:DNA helicase-2/ATP-dependent DNA helicase PcrA
LTRAFRRATYGFEELTLPSQFLADIPPALLEEGDARKTPSGTSTSQYFGRQSTQPVSTRWQQSSAPATPTRAASYQSGERVYHSKFGEGTVIAVEMEGSEEYVQVAFPEQGIKKLSTSYAPLEKR